MTALLLLPLCLLAGFLLKRAAILPPATPAVLNAFIIWLAFPAVVLTLVPEMLATLHPSVQLLIPTLAVWIAFLATTAAVLLVARACKWSRATTGALILTAGLGNTSFVGFPLIEALHGKEGIAFALIVDQLGSFLVLSTLGIFTASYFSTHKDAGPAFLRIAKKIATFPPFVAILIAVLLSRWPEFSNLLQPSLTKIGATLVPLALVSVGCQLHFEPRLLKERALELSFGLSLKLLLIPALAFLVLRGLHDLGSQVTILELGMGPMITAAIVATEFGLDGDLANLMVGVGTPLAVVSVLLWNLAL